MYPKLTMHDIEVIMSVYKYRYLSTSQIKCLHFPSDKAAWRRLAEILKMDLLKSFTVPNIPERIFYLDKKGVDIVSIELQTDREDLAWHRQSKQPKDYYFLKHFLVINDFRITLTLACLQSPIELVDFIPEYTGEQTKEGYVKKYIRDYTNYLSHTPDGVFCLAKDGSHAIFFVEIDRGGEVVSDVNKGFLKCVVFYLNYFVSNGWKRYEKDFAAELSSFHVLFTTTSQERLKHMREAVTNYSFSKEGVKRLLWGTVQSWLRVETVFDPIWQSMDVNDSEPYRIG